MLDMVVMMIIALRVMIINIIVVCHCPYHFHCDRHSADFSYCCYCKGRPKVRSPTFFIPESRIRDRAIEPQRFLFLYP